MRFWDSSALVPLLTRESTSESLQALVDEDPDIVTWWATDIECASALARRERLGADPASQTDAFARLDAIARDWQSVEPSTSVKAAARRVVRTHDLRAGDALQLAAAIVASVDQPQALSVVTLDGRLALAASREGFPILPR